MQYQVRLKRWVQAINEVGMVAILDLQWSAPSAFQATQQWPMADADHSITFWSQVARSFSADPNVIFDLFGEPFMGQGAPSASDWSCWLNGCITSFNPCSTGNSNSCTDVSYETAGMQELVTAVRNVGANQPIMLGGLNWAGDPCGLKDIGGDDSVCMWLQYEPYDPDHNLVVSFHTYDWTACATVLCWNADIAPLAKSVPVVTGEFGETNCSTTFVLSYMNWADAHNVSYLAWDWEVPDQSKPNKCVASRNGHNIGTNLMLLSNWNGTPSTSSPEGVVIRKHMQALDIPRLGSAETPPSAAPEAPFIPLLGVTAGLLMIGAWFQRRRARLR